MKSNFLEELFCSIQPQGQGVFEGQEVMGY
jgi:hypothetical protein